MRILKFLATAFLASLAVGSLHAQRADTDIQAKAREALEQAVANQNSTNSVAPAPAPKKKMQTTTPKAASPDSSVVTTKPTNADTDAKARQQLHQAATSPDARTVTVQPPPARTGRLSPEDEARAREAMRQAMRQVEAQQQSTAVNTGAPVRSAPPVTYRETTSPKPAPVTGTSAPPIDVNPPARPATAKQRQLEDLLQKYKMDQISPQEYFQQKAKILAEPGQ